MKKDMNKNSIYGKANYNEDVVKIVKILVVVVLVLGLVYLGTAILTGEINLGKETKEEAEVEIQYEEIIAGEILNRIDTEYYVLLFNFTSDDATNLLTLKDSYSHVNNSLPVYIVDLDKKFNSILTPLENEEIIEIPSNVSDLRVKDATLLKVKGGKVISRVTTFDNIEETFNSLTK